MRLIWDRLFIFKLINSFSSLTSAAWPKQWINKALKPDWDLLWSTLKSCSWMSCRWTVWLPESRVKEYLGPASYTLANLWCLCLRVQIACAANCWFIMGTKDTYLCVIWLHSGIRLNRNGSADRGGNGLKNGRAQNNHPRLRSVGLHSFCPWHIGR